MFDHHCSLCGKLGMSSTHPSVSDSVLLHPAPRLPILTLLLQLIAVDNSFSTDCM